MNPDFAATLVFVYGTLKRGGSNHALLAGQRFVGPARTCPGFRLYAVADYPGMVGDVADRQGVAGEVWAVDAATLLALDELEGLAEGLYRRAVVPLQNPFSNHAVQAYLYRRSVDGCRLLADGSWPVASA